MQRIVDALYALFDLLITPFVIMWEFSFSYLFQTWESFKQWNSQFVTETLVESVADIIPQGFIDFINQPSISLFTDLIGDVLWFIPVVPILIIYLVAYTNILIIRVIRYVVGFVPGVEA